MDACGSKEEQNLIPETSNMSEISMGNISYMGIESAVVSFVYNNDKLVINNMYYHYIVILRIYK